MEDGNVVFVDGCNRSEFGDSGMSRFVVIAVSCSLCGVKDVHWVILILLSRFADNGLAFIVQEFDLT